MAAILGVPLQLLLPCQGSRGGEVINSGGLLSSEWLLKFLGFQGIAVDEMLCMTKSPIQAVPDCLHACLKRQCQQSVPAWDTSVLLP